jgi:serine/threonine protein kinase
MELCENGDIKAYLERCEKQKITVDQSVRSRFLEEICKGMAFLHSKNIIHRDLKCGNVLLNTTVTCKIMDFGISTRVKDERSKTWCIGTSRYMAPEICKGKNYNEMIDVYSFSIMMWETITGNFDPYNTSKAGSSDRTINYAVAYDPELRPNIDRKHIKDYQAKILRMCWDEDPKKRMSFEEILDELIKGKLKHEKLLRRKERRKSVIKSRKKRKKSKRKEKKEKKEVDKPPRPTSPSQQQQQKQEDQNIEVVIIK